MRFANKIASSRMDIREVASGPSFSEILCSPLKVLHHCLVKGYVGLPLLGATFKEASHMFFKIKQTWENVP